MAAVFTNETTAAHNAIAKGQEKKNTSTVQRASNTIRNEKKNHQSIRSAAADSKIRSYTTQEKKTDERKAWQTMFFEPVGNIRRDEGRHIK